ncbi:uncharacterized protein SCHCODRAFT_02612518 [Schizophyllum commune H4-8]|uniref:uncharacterized protein n=1 Tax=Schizophyllum commune (strain H4-8 / FGSC 9210) TaxID=578458 RepID=UPI00215F9CE6|nr:uncharacterized protein SCHCODRAFT_02612518 [Schizophyllum commune H4-8]KAI5898573.1 hypothetical protein SCHCODRAFT_02612518 [Schizophyllum commune H4-8]
MSRSRASILPFAPWPRFRVQKPCRGRTVCTPASAKFERSYPGISAPIGDSSREIAVLILCQQPALRPTTCPPFTFWCSVDILCYGSLSSLSRQLSIRRLRR